MAVIKYRIYYSTDKDGPWTLANSTLIDDDPNGNEYTLTGLKENTQYYLKVVGGVLDDSGQFVPLVGQHIGPANEPALSIDSAKGVLTFSTFSPKVNKDGILELSFEVI